MLELRDEGGTSLLAGNDYELVLARNEPARADLRVRGVPAGTWIVAGACDTDGQHDAVVSVSSLIVHRASDGIVLEIPAQTSLWGDVSYFFQATPSRIEHYAVRRGRRGLDRLSYGFARIGSDELLSRATWQNVFDPEPNAFRKHYFESHERATIGVSSDKSYYRGNWFFTPGPLCYAMDLGEAWLVAGIAARPGENNFDQFEYRGEDGGFGFHLHYGGHVDSPDLWESPHLVLMPADSELAGVGAYCDLLRAARLVPSGNESPQSDWWREPIFCGWGEQVALERRTSIDRAAPILAADLCTEPNYRSFLTELRRHDLEPGTIVVDDKWQACYGLNDADMLKWPDLGGFVAEQHAVGRRVLLWLRAWHDEGVPAEECLVGRDGPLAVDPSSQAYEARLRGQVRHMLADVGADGFKIDFTHCLPVAPGVRSDNGTWGIELLYRLLWIMRDEAKQTKPDALIMAHTANPYFAGLVDMLRLNDIANVPGVPSYLESMQMRAEVARRASPGWLIDTDNWPSPNREAWLEYCRAQPALGIPSLYYARRLYYLSEAGEITDQALRGIDYAEIAELWARYRSTL